MGAAAIQPFAPLDADTEAALRASIKRFGVVVPIVVDGRGRVIDGHHRKRIAAELNVQCPQIVRAAKDDDDCNALAYSLNADRRQMTVEQRREVVADLRAQGYSLRAISGVTGASLGTVHNDVQRSGVQPEHVTGDDGKGYAPTRPTSETPKLDTDEPPPNVNEDGEIEDDAPPPAPPPKETKAERAIREEAERIVSTNKGFGDALIGMWSILGNGDVQIPRLVENWNPEHSRYGGVEAHQPVFTAEGIHRVADLMHKLAEEWGPKHG